MAEFVPPISGKPRAPVNFGEYEVSRSSDPRVVHQRTAAFKTRAPKASKLEKTGDPGAYNPYHYDDEKRLQGGHSRKPKSFDSTQFRELGISVGELGRAAPGPGHYAHNPEFANGRAYRKEAGNKWIFQSRSLQRPSSSSFVPEAGAYNPNMMSIYPKQQDSGAHMRSLSDRFKSVRDKPITPRHVGPGHYAQVDRTLYVEAQRSTAKASKARPGFGSTSVQRALPIYGNRGSPSAGDHQPTWGGWRPRGEHGGAGTPASGTPRTPRTPRMAPMSAFGFAPAAATPRTPRMGQSRSASAFHAPSAAPAAPGPAPEVQQIL